jgi:hypothetical protein
MRYFPTSLQQPGLGETVNVTGNRDTFLVQQMHAVATSIYQAKQRGDKITVSALLDRFKALADEYRGLGAGDLSGTDRFILATGQWIEDSVTAIPSALSALPQAVGSGLIRAAIPFALLWVGFVYLRRMR